MCFDLNTGFAPRVRLLYIHSVLFGNVARLYLQFDVLDLNTGLALVVKTLPDGTFSSIWVNRDGIRTNTVSIREHARLSNSVVNTLLRFRVGFVSILCLGHRICSCLTFSIPQYSNYKF